nr:uncharacterized protein LOC110802616 isoform X3 [Ipomoea batatas]GMD66008.1 uncharacterized protein LOC110802616 isoform X3 [Ipomoea batatas]
MLTNFLRKKIGIVLSRYLIPTCLKHQRNGLRQMRTVLCWRPCTRPWMRLLKSQNVKFTVTIRRLMQIRYMKKEPCKLSIYMPSLFAIHNVLLVGCSSKLSYKMPLPNSSDHCSQL